MLKRLAPFRAHLNLLYAICLFVYLSICTVRTEATVVQSQDTFGGWWSITCQRIRSYLKNWYISFYTSFLFANHRWNVGCLMKTQRKWQKCALINFGITSYVTFVLGLIIALVIASHGILGVFYFTVVDQIVTTPAVRPNIIYSVHLDTSVSIPVGLEAKYKKQSPSNYTDNTFPDDLITVISMIESLPIQSVRLYWSYSNISPLSRLGDWANEF